VTVTVTVTPVIVSLVSAMVTVTVTVTPVIVSLVSAMVTVTVTVTFGVFITFVTFSCFFVTFLKNT